ncbi:MAG TPA: TIGR01841 family phasin [Rhodoferax sp.]|jgi:phasin family protein|nr:TIGR01841 family phasin [Rhodoferax sp.]HPW85100.1 TIGR01841 family phasin [Rhodoferax sp.]HQC86758.1 TIGR01841 family phasin [Rhodoferax sp.]HQY77810.1 TIGR01841 family phasin [Rhodoferax sp.]
MTTVNVEQIVAANKTAVADAQEIGTIALAGFEKLVALNMAAAKSALFDTSADFMAAFSTQNPTDALAAQASLVKPLAEKSLAYSRSVYAIASETSAELNKIAEGKMAESQKAMSEAVATMAKNAPAGSETVVAMFTSAVNAGQNAIETAKSSAKKAMEMAEKQTTSAVETALSSVKTPSRKK